MRLATPGLGDLADRHEIRGSRCGEVSGISSARASAPAVAANRRPGRGARIGAGPRPTTTTDASPSDGSDGARRAVCPDGCGPRKCAPTTDCRRVPSAPCSRAIHARARRRLVLARDSGDDLTPRPSLDGSAEADVAILGAGYTGLWTAYYLLRRDPSLRVVVAEAEIAGFGASGRNGAWCAPDLNISMDRLAKLGRDAARRTQQATYDAVDEVGRVAEAEAIDIGYHRGGELLVARGPHQVPAIEEAYREYEAFGFADRYRLLDAAAIAERVRIAGAVRGLTTPDAAVIHPGLARGLARLVERLGGRMEVEHRSRRGPSGSTVRAAARCSARRPATSTPTRSSSPARRVQPVPQPSPANDPVYSLIVLTEPLSEAQWAEIGWADRACLASTRLSVDYLSRTEDGRIPVRRRGAPYRFGSPIRDAYDRHDPTHEMLRGMLRRWFPSLRDIGFTHAWGGPLGMPRDWHPTIAYDPRTGIAGARGYIGHGVSTANLAGRTLAELIRGEETERTTLPLVNHRSRSWGRSRSAGSACATRSGRWGGSTRGPSAPSAAVGPQPRPLDGAPLAPGAKRGGLVRLTRATDAQVLAGEVVRFDRSRARSVGARSAPRSVRSRSSRWRCSSRSSAAAS